MSHASSGLDALGDHAHPEPAAEVDGGVHDRGVARVVGEPHHERAVDLDLVEVELLEMAERDVAGAEVVERGGDADRAQPGEHLERALGVGHHDVLGDLQPQAGRREAALLEQPRDVGSAARGRAGRPARG